MEARRADLKHLLVTNDFPPKVGGIQSYLWELWRRLPPDDVTVLTTPWPDAARFDEEQAFRVERVPERMLLPTRSIVDRVDALAEEAGAEIVLVDPAVPAGLIGPRLARPYGVVLHGSEVTVPDGSLAPSICSRTCSAGPRSWWRRVVTPLPRASEPPAGSSPW